MPDHEVAVGDGVESPGFWIGRHETGEGFRDGNNVEAVCHARA